MEDARRSLDENDEQNSNFVSAKLNAPRLVR